MKKYKLTSQELTTYNDYLWELGVTAKTSGKGDLCGPGWLHCYSHPGLALLFNPMHACIDNPRLFEIEVGGRSQYDKGLKEGWTEMTLINEIPCPEIDTEFRITFAILVAMEVYNDASFVAWANKWLSNEDRGYAAAYAAAEATRAAAYAAAEATRAAVYAAYAAAEATRAADFIAIYNKTVELTGKGSCQ